MVENQLHGVWIDITENRLEYDHLAYFQGLFMPFISDGRLEICSNIDHILWKNAVSSPHMYFGQVMHSTVRNYESGRSDDPDQSAFYETCIACHGHISGSTRNAEAYMYHYCSTCHHYFCEACATHPYHPVCRECAKHSMLPADMVVIPQPKCERCKRMLRDKEKGFVSRRSLRYTDPILCESCYQASPPEEGLYAEVIRPTPWGRTTMGSLFDWVPVVKNQTWIVQQDSSYILSNLNPESPRFMQICLAIFESTVEDGDERLVDLLPVFIDEVIEKLEQRPTMREYYHPNPLVSKAERNIARYKTDAIYALARQLHFCST